MSVCSLSRGKEFGHDVDFLLSTPEQHKEETLLLSLVDSLRRQVSRRRNVESVSLTTAENRAAVVIKK